MIFNIFVVSVSVLMLMYWFRYTCLLMLRTKPVRDYSQQVVAANNLNVVEVQSRLAAPGGALAAMDELQRMLERDYRLLMYLMHHVEAFQTSGYEVEQIMLMGNYRLTKIGFALSKRLAAGQASRQLSEMASIITHFANLMGERAALSTTA